MRRILTAVAAVAVLGLFVDKAGAQMYIPFGNSGIGLSVGGGYGGYNNFGYGNYGYGRGYSGYGYNSPYTTGYNYGYAQPGYGYGYAQPNYRYAQPSYGYAQPYGYGTTTYYSSGYRGYAPRSYGYNYGGYRTYNNVGNIGRAIRLFSR